MAYLLTFYVKSLPPNVGGCANGPVIRILEKYRNDRGIYEHELVHVRQWFRTLGVHSLLYLFSKRYRFLSEVEAYKEQAKHYPDDRRELFAWFISRDYKLNIPATEALAMLK